MSSEAKKYAVSSLIFTCVMVLVGYFAEAVTAGAAGSHGIGYWLRSYSYTGVHWWALFGAVFGIGVRYASAGR